MKPIFFAFIKGVFCALFMCGVINAMKQSLQDYFDADCYEVARELMRQGRLEELDPLVGDTACHIRSSMLIDVYNRLQNDQYDLTDDDREFLVLCRKLTISRKAIYNQYGLIMREDTDTDPFVKALQELKLRKTLSDLSVPGKGRRQENVRESQRRLAAMSVAYLQKSAHGLESLFESFSYKTKEDSLKRDQVSCMASLNIVLEKALDEGTPLIITCVRFCTECYNGVHQFEFCYQVQDGRFTLCERKDIVAGTAALLIVGYSLADFSVPINQKPIMGNCTQTERFEQFFISQDIYTILCANAIRHTQFSGCGKETRKSIDVDFAEVVESSVSADENQLQALRALTRAQADQINLQAEAFKQFADAVGTTLENPRLFVIDHILATTIQDE